MYDPHLLSVGSRLPRLAGLGRQRKARSARAAAAAAKAAKTAAAAHKHTSSFSFSSLSRFRGRLQGSGGGGGGGGGGSSGGSGGSSGGSGGSCSGGSEKYPGGGGGGGGGGRGSLCSSGSESPTRSTRLSESGETLDGKDNPERSFVHFIAMFEQIAVTLLGVQASKAKTGRLRQYLPTREGRESSIKCKLGPFTTRDESRF